MNLAWEFALSAHFRSSDDATPYPLREPVPVMGLIKDPVSGQWIESQRRTLLRAAHSQRDGGNPYFMMVVFGFMRSFWRNLSPLGLARLVAALFAVTTLLVAAACGRAENGTDDQDSLAFVDLLLRQRPNLTTDLISLPEGIGLDHLAYGWRIKAGEAARASFAEIVMRAGRVELFSADGDLTIIEAELGLPPEAAPKHVQVNVVLNNRLLGHLKVVRGWSTHRVKVPGRRVRTGRNVLEFRVGMSRILRTRLPRFGSIA